MVLVDDPLNLLVLDGLIRSEVVLADDRLLDGGTRQFLRAGRGLPAMNARYDNELIDHQYVITKVETGKASQSH